MFDGRLTRLDLRLAKRFTLSDPMKLQPSLLQDGRMLQFSASLTF
jgi:hypothetical protein